MNKKGFTLTELIAVIVILGVLMTVAIPNVLSIIERNKALSMIEDAKKFITEVEYKVRSDTSIILPTADRGATVIKLSYLTNTDLDQSPYGINYNKNNSFVVIARDCNASTHICTDTYYVTLSAIETKSNGEVKSNSRGIQLSTLSTLNRDDISIIKKGSDASISVPTSSIVIGSKTYQIIYVK